MKPWSKGIPVDLRSLVHLTPMNDIQRLEDTFRAHGNAMAAMLIEPIQGNCCGISATKEYVQRARELCTQFGVLMIIDEVKPASAWPRAAFSRSLGVVPDISTFAKALANGYPISAIAGREEVMRTIRYGGAGMAAPTPPTPSALPRLRKTLRILDETPALDTIAAYGEQLKAGMSAILKRRNITHSFTGTPRCSACSSPTPRRQLRAWKKSDYSFYDAMALHLPRPWHHLRTRQPRTWFVCEAHDASCLAETLAAFETAVDRTLEQVAQAAE